MFRYCSMYLGLIGVKYLTLIFVGNSTKGNVGSFHKKFFLTKGVEKVNQVMKKQRAKAEIEKALQKNKQQTKTGTQITCSTSFDSFDFDLFSFVTLHICSIVFSVTFIYRTLSETDL